MKQIQLIKQTLFIKQAQSNKHSNPISVQLSIVQSTLTTVNQPILLKPVFLNFVLACLMLLQFSFAWAFEGSNTSAEGFGTHAEGSNPSAEDFGTHPEGSNKTHHNLSQDKAALNVVCSAKPETCQWIRDRFVAEHQIPTTITRMSSGAVLKVIEENSKESTFDVWWGGTGDTHLKAAANDRLLEFTPVEMQKLLGWSKHIWELSQKHTIGVYSGTLGIIVNEEVLATQNLDLPSCWSDLGDPKYRGQIIIGNPSSSGTAYTFLSTIFQIYGKNQRNQILAEIKENVRETTSSGYGALIPVAQGKAGISIAFVHDIKPLVDKGYALKIISPCEGTGYEIGTASILKTSKRVKDARKFIEYTLQPTIQDELTTNISLQMFSNIGSKRSTVYEDSRYLNVINYDFYIYSRPDVRADVLSTWDQLGE